MGTAEPERELIRRIVPFALPAAGIAFGAAAILSGADAGWSAAVGTGVVTVNFVANAWSVAWAARISPVILMAVGLGGFVVRLGVIAATIALLQQLGWFSVVAFVGALVPATIALLAVEMRMLAGRMQADLWTFSAGASGVRR